MHVFTVRPLPLILFVSLSVSTSCRCGNTRFLNNVVNRVQTGNTPKPDRSVRGLLFLVLLLRALRPISISCAVQARAREVEFALPGRLEVRCSHELH